MGLVHYCQPTNQLTARLCARLQVTLTTKRGPTKVADSKKKASALPKLPVAADDEGGYLDVGAEEDDGEGFGFGFTDAEEIQ